MQAALAAGYTERTIYRAKVGLERVFHGGAYCWLDPDVRDPAATDSISLLMALYDLTRAVRDATTALRAASVAQVTPAVAAKRPKPPREPLPAPAYFDEWWQKYKWDENQYARADKDEIGKHIQWMEARKREFEDQAKQNSVDNSHATSVIQAEIGHAQGWASW